MGCNSSAEGSGSTISKKCSAAKQMTDLEIETMANQMAEDCFNKYDTNKDG